MLRATLFILLVATSGTASATPGENIIVDKCVAAAGDDDEALYACIGSVSDPCQKAPGGETTMGMVACFGAEAGAWDSLLNRYFRTVLATLEPAQQASLRDLQRDWIDFRDKSCRFAAGLFAGGSIAGPIAGECAMRKTAEQALWLKVWVDQAR